MKRTIHALDRIQTRLESELDSTPGDSEKNIGYRSGISEAITQVMEIRKTAVAQK